MIQVADYEVIEQINKSSNSVIYRAKKGNKNVILKILNKNFLSSIELNKYQQEYEITKYSNIDGIIKSIDFIKENEKNIIVFEDFGATSLGILHKQNKLYRNKKNDNKFNLTEFLKIAIKISTSLENIHKKSLIHKDINPSNIVMNKESGELKIIDFGISSYIDFESSQFFSSKTFDQITEGTLHYISPEQSGRINRVLDYRTDFYSLGITFYELITGEKLFKEEDHLALIHSHIARKPVFNKFFTDELPNSLIEIIYKLISKEAQDRYQSAWGLKKDLEKCLKSIDNNIKSFKIAENDISDKLCISQKLFGREKETDQLFETFKKVQDGSSEFLLISGYSGVGKSALIQEIYKPILLTNSYFCKGKFEQFERDIPYKALKQACEELVNQTMSKSKKIIKSLKHKLLLNLGINSGVMTSIIPDLEKIIGKQPEVNELNPNESQNRFLLAFKNFLKSFSSKENPIVFFIDDLQWADTSSINLISKIFINDEVPFCFLIGTYRDNEVDDNHPLAKYMIANNSNSLNKSKIHLNPLNKNIINELIAFTFKKKLHESSSLSEIIYTKTDGNPFFVNQLLKSLYNKKLIFFDFDNYKWEWDLKKIQTSEVSPNVVDFVLEKLLKCSINAIKILKIASCIGSSFSLRLLTFISKNNFKETIKALMEVIDTGAIIPINSSYMRLLYFDENNLREDEEYYFKFHHDKFHQAAYLLNKKDELKELHLFIGRKMLLFFNKKDYKHNIINIVQQLNKGANLVKSEAEKINFASLNLQAGEKAWTSAAYKPAMKYFLIGKKFLKQINLDENYNLFFNVSKKYSEAAYICGEFEKAEKNTNELIKVSKNDLDRAELHYLQSLQYTTLQKLELSLDISRKGLAILGFALNDDYDQDTVLKEAKDVRRFLNKQGLDNLINLPDMKEPRMLLIVKLMQGTFLPAYFMQKKNLLTFGVLQSIKIALKDGLSSETAYSLNVYAMILGHVLGDLKTANKIGETSFELNERFNNPKNKTMNLFTNITLIQFWNKSVEHCVKSYERLIEIGLESGDLIYTSYSFSNILQWNYSLDINKAIIKADEYLPIINNIGFQDSIDIANIFQNLRLNLADKVDGKYSLSNPNFSEDEMVERLKVNKSYLVLALYYIYKIQPCYFYENYNDALIYSEEAEKYIEALNGQAHIMDFTIFSFLSISAIYNKVDDNDKKIIYMKGLEEKLAKVTLWYENKSENFEHLKLMMEAEMARIHGENLEADQLFQKSIEISDKNKFLSHRAIVTELAAKLWLEVGKENFAKMYFKKAIYYYEIWGASRKVKHLRKNYLENKDVLENDGISFTSGTLNNTKKIINANTIIRSYRLLLGEKKLENLIEKMIKLISEHAGAEKCLLVLPKEGKWFIEAEYKINSGYFKTMHSLLLEENSNHIPSSIFYYTINTGKTTILNNVIADKQFLNDNYIKEFKPLSVLCLPLINNGNVDGLLYLENNLTSEAFTEKRVEALELFTAQAAISLENTLLYEELEDRVKLRTSELLKVNNRLEKLNFEKNELINIVTHNLKSPLSSIVGFSSLINYHKETKEEIGNYSSRIMSESKRMLEMIGKLLDINKIEEGNYKINIEEINLNLFIEDLIINYSEAIKEKKQNLEFVSLEENIILKTDEAWLFQILDNLISNAIKFSKPNKKIELKVLKENNKSLIKIIDQGPGFTELDKKKIFNKFARLSALPTGNETSTGLGLSIVKKMVELLNGNIVCKSEKGKGSTFIISFDNN